MNDKVLIESDGVWFQKFVGPDGGEETFTLRKIPNSPDSEFINRVKIFKEQLEKAGYSLKQREAAPVAKPSAPVGGEKSFPVEAVKLASGGEHPRWVVMGGNFKKFGVTAWPEVLEAAGMLEHLDPMKENKPQASWTAFYTERMGEDGKTKPDKVVRLERA